MSKRKAAPLPQVEVSDPAAAFRRFQDAARKLLATPKNAPPAKTPPEVPPKDRPN